MLQKIIQFVLSLLGIGAPDKSEQLGRVEQQRDDQAESAKEAEGAKEIDENNSRLSDAELAAKLQRPPDSGGGG